MMKHSKWKSYAVWILFSEAVGALSGWLTREGSRIYSATVAQPPLSPPPIVFPIVWGILFGLLGIGAARIYQSEPSQERTSSLRIYFAQLAFNFLWSIIFFNYQAWALAFFWLVALWILILWMIFTFHRVDKPAAWLQVPYVLWVTFAGYLNFGVWMLNR